MNIFEALRSDHSRQRDLVERLLATHGASEERKDLFDRLSAELEAHAGAEERYFYVPLMEHDLTQTKARHSVVWRLTHMRSLRFVGRAAQASAMVMRSRPARGFGLGGSGTLGRVIRSFARLATAR